MMAKLEGQRLVVELSEVEAKIAARTLPLLSPVVDFYTRIWIRTLFHMALLGKDKWREIKQRADQGEDSEVLAREFVQSIGSEGFMSLGDVQLPNDEEIDRIFDWGEG